MFVRVSRPKKKRKQTSAKRSRSASGSALTASKERPSTYSVTSTRRVESAVSTHGTRMNGWPRKARPTARWFCASIS